MRRPDGLAAALATQFTGQIGAVALEPAPPFSAPLDLASMARQALNYLRGNPDPSRRYECRFSLGPLGIPSHVPLVPSNQYAFDPVSLADTDCRMDLQYAHLRAMAGQSEPDEVEQGVHTRVMSYLHDDGLVWVNPVAWTGAPIDGEWATTWGSGQVMTWLAEEFARTGDQRLADQARGILHAVRGLASWDGDRAWYPFGPVPHRDGQWLTEGWAAEHCRNYPAVVEPLVRYTECTGDPAGLEFAQALAEGFLAGLQTNQGALRIDPETGAFQKHVHLHTRTIWGVAHLGAVLGEPRYLDWADRAYRFVLANGTDYGWYPEFIPQGEYRSEICAVGDMVSAGAWLARGGRPDYWDHVERTARNTLRASQFRLTAPFVKLFEQLHAARPAAEVATALHDLRRLEGGFVAQSTFNDWVSYPGTLGAPGLSQNGIQMMGCCPPEGMRGLWEAWRWTVERRADGVWSHLHFDRDDPAAKVTADRGHRTIEPRVAGRYHLRPPAWAPRAEVTLTRDGESVPTAWGGPDEAYVVVEQVRPGERLTVHWPEPMFRQTFTAQSVPGRDQRVTVAWVGNDVVAVEPRGAYLPMFGAGAA